MRLESRVLTVCLSEQARRMHGCRALGSHFFMFIPKTGNPNCQPPWPRPPRLSPLGISPRWPWH